MIEWPPYSPDVIPIENIWAWIKIKLANDYPISEMFAVITPEMCARFCGNYE